ncbi:TonB-dependent receptor [Azospirillum sp. B4]|uniref:TonB-dependent receptor n=1 Tax=Azospirillum sp. B4 TaxID=95605 RepID=UPI0006796F10|nr:TonB-dependent receptor [Azospirillum sp. B4]
MAVILLAGAGAMLATAGRAQTAAPDDAAVLEEIVVTARKRAEPLGHTPLSITALKGEEMRERGLNTLEDVAAVTPGVSFREDVAGRAGPAITIRGVGFDDYHAGGSPSAAVHIDEVYQGSSAWITAQLFDIDHVEILKGPQGTLYGQNSPAGAINILTRQPTDTAQGYITASYGSYDALRVEGGVGGPIAPDLSGRIAFLRQSGGGYMTAKGNAAQAGTTPLPGVIPPLAKVDAQDGFGDADFWGVRGTLRYEPGADTRITLETSYGRDRGANTQTDVLGRSATGFTEPDADPRTFYANVLPFIDAQQVGGRLKLEQDVGDDVTFTGIAAQQHLRRTYTLDPGSPLRAFDILYGDTLDQTTLEARFANRKGGAVDWVAGAFYFRDRVASDQNEDVTDLYRSIIDARSVQRRESAAAFGEADWHVAPGVTATTGLRYTHEDARFSGATVDLNPYGTSIVSRAFALPVVFNNHFTDDNVSGRGVLTWTPDEASTLYASISNGYKSGGFDGATIFTASKAQPFKSETVLAYEVGYKWFPRDRPYTLTLSAFYDDFSDMQATAVVNLGGIPTNVRTNVASATLYGGEMQMGLRPLPGLDLTAGLALLDSNIDDIVSADKAEAARRKDHSLPNAPGLSFTAGARYRREMAGGWVLTPSVNLSYTGPQFMELDHYIEAAGYALLDARLALEEPGGRWSLALWGRNLTDKTYFVGIVPAVSGGAVIGQQRIAGAPRTVGGELSYRF